MKKYKYNAVEVLWRDSASLKQYWHGVLEGTKTAKGMYLNIRSVGILVEKDKDKLVISQSMGLVDKHTVENMGGFLTIPREAVIKIRKLKRTQKSR